MNPHTDTMTHQYILNRVLAALDDLDRTEQVKLRGQIRSIQQWAEDQIHQIEEQAHDR